jgi:arylsulfatase A-like enzyme
MSIKQAKSMIILTVVLASITSAGHAVYQVLANNYFPYRMFRIAAFTIVDNLNKGIVTAVVMCVALFLLIVLARFFLNYFGITTLPVKEKNKIVAFLIILIFFSGVVWSIQERRIVRFSPEVTKLVYLGIFLYGIFLNNFFTKVKIGSKIKGIWFALGHFDTRPTRVFVLFLGAVMLVLNIGVFLDSHINSPPGPNVILIGIDTLRSDLLESGITPRLNEFAKRSIDFKTCISQSTWTTTSFLSLFTSAYPEALALDAPVKLSFPEGELIDFKFKSRPITLAEILRDKNYYTAAVTAGHYVHSKYGFDQGFVTYQNDGEPLENGIVKLKRLLAKLKNRKFFIFFHTYEVHAPYVHTRYLDSLIARGKMTVAQKEKLNDFIQATPEIRQFKARAAFKDALIHQGIFKPYVCANLYYSGVRYTDNKIGELLDYLKEMGLMENTIIVLTSDHGEEFAEHNKSKFYDAHTHGLFDELIRVPLILYLPPPENLQGRVVDYQVGLIDVLPTILARLKIESVAKVAGVDLLKYLKNNLSKDLSERPIFSVTRNYLGLHMKSIRLGKFKYIRNFGCVYEPEEEGLYNLAEKEQTNLSKDFPLVAEDLKRRLEDFLKTQHELSGSLSGDPNGAKDFIVDTRSLGYLQ